MIVDVDLDDPVPPYEQLRAQVAAMIVAGTLETGFRLPPIRQLASDLGLANGTVARAYRELESAGLVTAGGRRGTRVAERTHGAPGGAAVVDRHVREAAARYATAVRQLGVSDDMAVARVREALDASAGGVEEAGEASEVARAPGRR